jgi:hypothetical protein
MALSVHINVVDTNVANPPPLPDPWRPGGFGGYGHIKPTFTHGFTLPQITLSPSLCVSHGDISIHGEVYQTREALVDASDVTSRNDRNSLLPPLLYPLSG